MKLESELLNNRIDDAIKEVSFTALEIAGFNSDISLTLKAGALIGYSLAMADAHKIMDAKL